MFAPFTVCPAASTARARRRMESPAVTVRLRGVTSMRVIGDGGKALDWPCWACCAAHGTASTAIAMTATRWADLVMRLTLDEGPGRAADRSRRARLWRQRL